MGLDLKEIQGSIWGFLELSCSFVKKYPVVSCVLLFFFLMYMFLPSVFTFLLFSVPVVSFVIVAIRLILRLHQQNLERAIGEQKSVGISARKTTPFAPGDLVENERENSSMQPQSVRRRKAKERDKQVSVQEVVEEKDMVFSAICNDELIDKAALIEENPKEIQVVNVDPVIDCAENSSVASQRSRHECGDASGGRTDKFDYGGSELDVDSSDDDEEEEEEQEDGKKAVEWTEDDQKNLMDLGFSELERNKRLESLIARRKARKMLSMQVRRTLMNKGSADPGGQIASVLLPRANPFATNVSSEQPQVSPTPGSAPSVLIPMHNPFDIPYDPQEEKPNLSGGSFQEEFMATGQKDLIFCRHGSFSLGAYFPGPGEFDLSRCGTFYCPNFATRPRAPEIAEYSRFKNPSGNEDPIPKLIQTESSLECKPMLQINSSHDDAKQEVQPFERVCNIIDVPDEDDRNEVNSGSNVVRDGVTGGSSSSSSSEVNVPFSAANKEAILKSLSFSVPKNIAVDVEYNGRRNGPLCDGSPLSHRNKIPEERFFFPDKVLSHTPSQSIASDMLVEVSDVGSTELSVDGNISDGGSLSYEAELDGEKEVNSGSEEMWVASSQLSRVEEYESRSSEVHEVSEQDILEVGFSGMKKKTNGIVPSNVVPEKAVEEDSVEASVSFPSIELAERSQSHLINFDGNVHDEARLPSTSCASDALSTENLASSTLKSSKKLESHPSHEKVSGEMEDRSDCPGISDRELNTDCNTHDEVAFAYNDTEILEFIKSTYGEAPLLIKQEATEGPSTITMGNDEKPLEITDGYSRVTDHDYSNPTELFEGEYGQRSSLTSNSNGSENIQDRRGEPVVIHVGSFGSIHSDNDTIPSAMQPETTAERGPSDSSSSSSSTVTEEKFPISEVSQSNFNPATQINVQEIASEVVEDNFADRSLPESSDLPASCLSDVRDPENPLQGESQTLLESESHRPAEESVDMNSSEESRLEKLAEHKDMPPTPRPIEKMGRGESTKATECDEGPLDTRHSGFSQVSTGSTSLTMLPELVVEEVPMASSSSSSPKSDMQKMVAVEQVPSSNIDPKKQLKVQKSDEENVEINLLNKLPPENLESPAQQNTLHLSSDSTAHLSSNRDFEEIQEPSNPPNNVTQDLNSIQSVKVPEVIANNDMRNFATTDETNDESHIFSGEGHAGVQSNMSDESIAKPIDRILETSQEDHGPEIVEVEVPEVNPSTGLIMPVMLVGNAESGISQIHESFISDTNSSDLLPEGAVEQVPMASSSSSSPNSVLQTKFSIDQGSSLSLDNLDQETLVLAQQSETEMDQNASTSGLGPENLTAPVPQNSFHLTVDPRGHLSDNVHSGGLQEPSDPPGKSTKEDSFNYVSHSESDKKEEKLNSTSIEDGVAQPELLKQDAPIDPTKLSDETSVECPGGGLKQLSENSVVSSMSEPVRSNENSRTAERTEELGENDSSKLTVNLGNLEATEVVEGEATNTNVIGLSKPDECDDDSRISVEREEPTNLDPGKRSFEEASSVSNEHELVGNILVAEEDLRTSFGETDGESQRVMRSEDVAQQPKNLEVAESRTAESDEGKSNKQTEPDAMVGFSQPTVKKDALKNSQDTDEFRTLADHEDVRGPLRSGLNIGGLDQSEGSKGEIKE